MRIKVHNMKDAERLSNLFEESHVEKEGKHVYLVVDKIKRKVRV